MAVFRGFMRGFNEGLYGGTAQDPAKSPSEPPTSQTITEAVELFLAEYRDIATRISSHRRYEKEFGESKVLTKSFSDPFESEKYALELLRVCRAHEAKHGRRLRVAGNENEKVDRLWILLVQVLIPGAEDIRTQLDDSTRTELAGHIIARVWNGSGLSLGSFMRTYYDRVYTTPPEALSAATPEELLRLLKLAALVADKVAESLRKETEARSKTPRPSPAQIVSGIAGSFGIQEMRQVDKVMRAQTRLYLAFMVSVAVFAVSFVVPGTLDSLLRSTGYGAVAELWQSIASYIAFAASVVALGSLMKILVRNTRKRLYIATFRFIVLSELASRYEIESVLLARYGAANARKLLSRAK